MATSDQAESNVVTTNHPTESQSQPQPPSSYRVFVGNLVSLKEKQTMETNPTVENNDGLDGKEVDGDDQVGLKNEFERRYGKVLSVHYVKKKFAFVAFEDEESMSEALEDGRSNSSCPYDIRPAHNRQQREERYERQRKDAAARALKNPKRLKDQRQRAGDKLCLEFIRSEGKGCSRGAKCQYSHDIIGYMKRRPPDIEIDVNTASTVKVACPNIEAFGYCKYGITCRFGSCHINLETGENLDQRNQRNGEQPDNPAISDHNSDSKPTLLTKKARSLLRKNKYNFKCHGNGSEEAAQTKTTTASTAGDNKVIDASATATLTTLPSVVMSTSNPITDSACSISSAATTMTTANWYIPGKNEPRQPKKLVDFQNKVYVAPLTTVGNLPFRRIMKRFGADITCGEMALSGCLLQGNNSEWALLKKQHHEEDVFGIQLAASHPDQVMRACELIETFCNNNSSPNFVDFVDLNLGCPIDLICNKGMGSALMMKPKRLEGIVAAMTSTLSCPITLKMRTGYDVNKPVAHKLISNIVEKYWASEADDNRNNNNYTQNAIAAIMIHGRSRQQRYQQLANWDYIHSVATSVHAHGGRHRNNIQVIGNGDIYTFLDYEENVLRLDSRFHDDDGDGDDQGYSDKHRRTTKASPTVNNLSKTAMIGRAALIKPWLPAEIKERKHWDITANERLEILKLFVSFGLQHWGSDQQGVNNTRRYMLEWLSFLHRYIPVGIYESNADLNYSPKMNERPPSNVQRYGRSDLEILMMSPDSEDWLKITEMMLGPTPPDFRFEPKHKSKSYSNG